MSADVAGGAGACRRRLPFVVANAGVGASADMFAQTSLMSRGDLHAGELLMPAHMITEVQ